MMGTGSLTIDVATLRRILPSWMRAAGFVVDDSRMAETGVMAVDAGVPGWGEREIEGYVASMLRGLRITDGGIWCKNDTRQGCVFIKVDYERI